MSSMSGMSGMFSLGPEMNDATRAMIGAFIGAVLGALLMQGVGVAVGVAVGVSLGILLGADRSQQQAASRTQGTVSLREIERRIGERLVELRNRERRLAETRAQWERRATTDTGRDAAWLRIHQQLLQAGDALARQRDRYHVKLWEVTLIRWQNKLDPLVVDWSRLTHEGCSKRLTVLDLIEDEGIEFLRAWTDIDLEEFPDARRCLDRLKASLDACRPLREHLIVKQATLALTGLAPAEDAIDPMLAMPPSTASAFQARASLADVTSAFAALEGEYDRLRSEQRFADEMDTVRQLGR
ncbi:MAG: hypothetical protein ACKO14_10935 [Armatimonadota bacterium]